MWIQSSHIVWQLKLRKIGNSVGVVLPKEALARLRAKEGDTLCLTEAPEGSFRVTVGDAEFVRKMDIAESLSQRYRNALKELAK